MKKRKTHQTVTKKKKNLIFIQFKTAESGQQEVEPPPVLLLLPPSWMPNNIKIISNVVVHLSAASTHRRRRPHLLICRADWKIMAPITGPGFGMRQDLSRRFLRWLFCRGGRGVCPPARRLILAPCFLPLFFSLFSVLFAFVSSLFCDCVLLDKDLPSFHTLFIPDDGSFCSRQGVGFLFLQQGPLQISLSEFSCGLSHYCPSEPRESSVCWPPSFFLQLYGKANFTRIKWFSEETKQNCSVIVGRRKILKISSQSLQMFHCSKAFMYCPDGSVSAL